MAGWLSERLGEGHSFRYVTAITTQLFQGDRMGFEERGKALEDAFFAKKNRELLEQVKQDLDVAAHRSELKDATGITEDDMLDRILTTGVNAESLAAMSIAPLVLVAWADGSISTKEHEAVASGAEKAGIKTGSTAYQLLQGWLTEKPDDSLMSVWADYTKAMCEKLQAGDKVKLSEQVLGRCKSVAESAGGFLGLGSISSKEQAVLDALAAAFE